MSVKNTEAETGPETVYVATRTCSGNLPKLHTDRNCRALKPARTVHEKQRALLDDDRPVCKHCAGTAETFAAEDWTKATRELLIAMDPDEVVADE